MSTAMHGHGHFREIQYDNNFGLRDSFVINEAETILTVLASAEGAPEGNLDMEHFKAIHKHLLGDMYPWAGQLRSEDHWVGQNRVKSPSPGALVEQDTKRVLDNMSREPFSQMKQSEFADKLATYYTQLYRISPFPDGNARATRMLIDSVADKHDMQIEWSKLPNGALNVAAEEAVAGNANKLKTLMRHIVEPLDLFEMYSIKSVKSRTDHIVLTSGLSDQVLPTEALASAEDVIKLARHAKLEVVRSLGDYAAQGFSAFRNWDMTSIEHQQQADKVRQSGASQIKEVMAQLEGYSPSASAGSRHKMPGPG